MVFNNRCEEMFKEFAQRFPRMAEKAVECWLSGPTEITILFEDRSKSYYDIRHDTARFGKGGLTDASDESDWMNEFASRLRKKLSANGMSQRDLADQIGRSPVTISRYTLGRSIPDAFTMRQIAEALDCSVLELVEF